MNLNSINMWYLQSLESTTYYTYKKQLFWIYEFFVTHKIYIYIYNQVKNDKSIKILNVVD